MLFVPILSPCPGSLGEGARQPPRQFSSQAQAGEAQAAVTRRVVRINLGGLIVQDPHKVCVLCFSVQITDSFDIGFVCPKRYNFG